MKDLRTITTIHNDLQQRDGIATHPSESVGVYRDSAMFPQDMGKNWSAGTVVGIFVDAFTYAGNGVVLAGDDADGSIYRSTNYGLTWSAGIPTGGIAVRSLIYVGNGVVLAGDEKNGGSIYRSTDYGLTWDAGTVVNGFVISFTYVGNGVVLAGTSTGYVYRSTDYGLTWDAGTSIGGSIYGLTHVGNGVVLAVNGNNNNIYRSTDYGLTWSAGIPTGGGNGRSVTYAGNGVVLVGTSTGIIRIRRSTDYGLTWSGSSAISPGSIKILAYLGNGIVLTSANDGSIYRSTDYGLTWDAGTTVGGVIASIIYVGNGVVLAGTSTGYVYRSDISYKLDESQATPITTIPAYASGTVYSLTATPALLDFGTTDPSITLNQAGTYLLKAKVNLKYNGATFAANRTVTLKLRRTNNTAADISNSSTALTTGIITTLTETFAVIELPDVVYTTLNKDDIIEVWGDIDVVPTLGSLDAVEASIIATRLY